ncbi:hypothetical protein HJC23_004960 [Cyclotella cryptica]|uniref:Uncharacterized protein n=1 Tax=Cyclotella cryptica TaxID=29204 RepID=A0ABD3PAB5_9STRA|eukprot:CCRYP_016622-RA/>CCRYP_016622-RA protein AED:0.25 eAED:0.25 QI:117/1/1/1/1/1/2/634/614
MKHRLSLIFATALFATCAPTSRGLSFLSIERRQHKHHGYTHRSRLFGVSNSQPDDNNEDSSHNVLMPEKKPQNNLHGVGATSPSAQENDANLEQKAILRPHAPKTPRPPNSDTKRDEDESMLNRARDLLDTQAQLAASRSPTRRIADEDYYRDKSTPESPSPESFREQEFLHEISHAQNDIGDTIPAVSTALESSIHLLTSGRQGRIIPPHRTSMELIRDSRRRAQKLLSRRDFETEKAEEKKARIKAKMEEELLNVDNRLKAKLDVVHSGIVEDVERMQALIYREMDLEEERMAQFNSLVENLKASAQAIKEDIASENEILYEMKALRSKLDGDSTSARQLDRLILRKQDLLSVESDLLKDLDQCTFDTRQAFMNCERRRNTMQDVLERVSCSVQFLESRECDWSDIDVMEVVLSEATQEVEESEARIVNLKDRIHFAQMKKDEILRESVDMQQPDSDVDAAAYDPLVDLARNSSSIVKLSDLLEKDHIDVVKQLAVSLGNATYSGSKATALALKTLLEAVTAKEGGVAADIARMKTNPVDFQGNATFKETARAAIDSIVDTTKVFLEQAASSEANKEARKSMRNVTNELVSAANAVSVLGTRAYQRLLQQKD